MKDTATRAREAHAKKLRRDALQLIFWLCVAFVAVLFLARSARADTVDLIPMPEVINGRTVLAQSDNKVLTWPANYVRLYHNAAGSPLSAETAEAVLRYSAWSWSQRTGLTVQYMGETTQAQIDGAIVVKWMTAYDMMIQRGLWVNGFTALRYYPSSGELVSAVITLKDSEWSSGVENSRKAAHTLMHEFGHSFGINDHSEDKHAVMYFSREHDRYALTPADVMMTGYQKHLCHAELTPHGDLYIPGINGAGVTLKPDNGLFHLSHEHNTGLGCSGTFDGETVTINEVKAFDGTYHNAVLVRHGDGWQVQ